MHAFLEYIPLVIFFAVYSLVDIYWATASLIVTSALHIVYFIVKREPVPTKNWIFFAIIAVFGGLTIFLHDDAFIKWKVTIINLVFATTLIISNKFFNKNSASDLICWQRRSGEPATKSSHTSKCAELPAKRNATRLCLIQFEDGGRAKLFVRI